MVKSRKVTMTKLKVYTESIFNRFKAIFYASGLIPRKDSTFYYHIYSFIILTVFHFSYALFMILYFFDSTDTENVVEGVFMCVLEIMSCIYITNLLINRNEIRRIEAILNGFELRNESEERLISSNMKFVEKVFIYFFIFTNIGSVGIIIGSVLTNTVGLIVYAWYPFDWQHNHWLHWTILVYQAVGMQFGCILNLTNQFYPVFFMVIIKSQLEVLGERLENINREFEKGNILKNKNNECSDEKFRSEVSSLRNSSKNDLIEFIKIHQEVCR